MAERDLAKAFELSGKKLPAAHLQLARLYEKKGDRARAADELEQYLRMAPDDRKADAIRSAIKTLLDRRLIVAKGHKQVVGRPMLYGTSKDFLIHFGLNDLSELPNLEDFEDLMSS